MKTTFGALKTGDVFYLGHGDLKEYQSIMMKAFMLFPNSKDEQPGMSGFTAIRLTGWTSDQGWQWPVKEDARVTKVSASLKITHTETHIITVDSTYELR